MKPKIHHGDPDRGIKRRRPHSAKKHRELIEQCLSMEPGDWVEIQIPRDRGMEEERRRLARVIDRNVRTELPEFLFRVRLTEARKVRVSCHVRPRRGRLSQGPQAS